ncbi:MAG: hypothetical protein HY22_04745 [[Candidatus Thermochlorobacteriaceae] bacterium GBChlB]|nr:MAG: hypothetical protein HY22_04745 [[Candidatus Thermochlorobacteriaceae] bacterium GBChlB]
MKKPESALMHLSIRLALFFTLLCLVSSLCAQPRVASSAKLQPVGRSYFQLDALFFTAGEEFAPEAFRRNLFSGVRYNDGQFTQTDLNFHYEYGVSERLSAVLKLGYRFFEARFTDNLDPRLRPNERAIRITASSFDETWLSARYLITKPSATQPNTPSTLMPTSGWTLSVQGGIKFPTGDITARIPTGTGLLDYDLRLLLLSEFMISDVPSLLHIEGGYRLRGGDYRDAIPIRVEFGVAAAKELLLRGSFNSMLAFGEFLRPVGITEEQTLTVVGDESYGQLTVGFVALFSPFINVSFDFNARIFGRSTFAGNTVQLGLIFR